MHRFAAVRLLAFAVLIFANLLVIEGQDSIYRLPAGTRIKLKLDAELSSKVAAKDDTFTAFVAKSVSVRDAVVLPAGTEVEGRVIDVAAASGGGHDGRLQVVFETLKFADTTRKIDGLLIVPERMRSSQTLNLVSIFGGIAGGAAAGAATRSATGALVGAAIGGGAGTTIAILRKGREARIPKDEEFEIELRKEVTLPVLDY